MRDVFSRPIAVSGLLLAVGIAACGAPAPEAPVPERAPAPAEALAPELPELPERDGALVLDLVYPPEGAFVTVRDSTFVFGSTGSGRARLTINGIPVPVEPNGAFLAFLPVPPDGVYRLEATKGPETARLERTVRVPGPPPELEPHRARIVEGSVSPRGAWAALPGEPVEVRFRGTPGGQAALVLPDGRRVPLAERRGIADVAEGLRTFGMDPGRLDAAREPVVAEYHGHFAAIPLAARDTSIARPAIGAFAFAAEGDRPGSAGRASAGPGRRIPEAASAPGQAWVELVVGPDTARAPLPLNLALLDPDRLPVAVGVDAGPEGATDGVVVARPAPSTTSHYFWPSGTELTVTGQRNGEFRVRLTHGLTAWVPAAEVRLLPPGTPPPRGIVGTVRMTPAPGYVDVRFAVPRRFPIHVEQAGRRVDITLFGAVSGTDWLQYGGIDSFIERAEWSQPSDDIYRLTLHLDRPAWGWDAFFAPNGDLVVRVRKPPEIDPDRPLAGLTIVVDAGHGGAEPGALGPTRLREADANLGIALRLGSMLERRGANVILTRTDDRTLPLYARTSMAEAADAHLLVSIHNNAFPDGVNPFANNGTSVYYFHPLSACLARELQRELLAELRLRNLGIGRSSLALVRPRWMPAALTETMHMMVPRQENALRDPDAQERIAAAHLRAIETFIRETAGRR
ncbi:MAG TPA: N-acetylmuramoyl-L-alanine amidase [Longimicrobiales bacterium]|nr:N-acetylmuramoyl-L-alanine amidase [Longimicrobiales bacterium]